MAEVGEVDPLVSGFHVYMKLSGSPTQSTCMTLSLFIFRKLMRVALSGNPESHFFNPPHTLRLSRSSHSCREVYNPLLERELSIPHNHCWPFMTWQPLLTSGDVTALSRSLWFSFQKLKPFGVHISLSSHHFPKHKCWWLHLPEGTPSINLTALCPNLGPRSDRLPHWL